MALKPVNNDAFYREVDEEMRRDQLKSVWQRYGIAIVAGVVLLLAAVGGYIWWQQRQEVRAGEHAELLTGVFDALDARRTQGVSEKLDTLVAEGSDGYRAAGLLTKADLAIQQQNFTQAAAIFKRVAEDEGLARPYRDLALVRQTAIEFDRTPPATVIARLGPLAKAGEPWFGSAGEMVALAHLKQNNSRAAAPIFAAMAKDETLPGSIRSRAVQMAGALGIDATADANTKE